LSADEAYYWVWSKHLQGGYLDHPPMVALWIRIGTSILGDTPLGVRLLAPWAALAGSLLIARAAEDFWPGRRAGIAAAVLLNATLMLNAGAVIITPDTPLLLFWTATLAALARLIRTGDGRWWLGIGLCCGLGFCSKYTAVLLAGAIGVWIAAVPEARRWLARRELYAAAAIGLACATPVLLWNAAHGWVSLAKQGGRAGDWNPAGSVRFLSELFVGQVGLATPGVFALGCLGIWQACRGVRDRSPAWTLLAAVTVLPACVFIEHALGDRVQANWPAVIMPGAILAVAGAGLRLWRPACLLGAAMVGAVFLQATLAPFGLPRSMDFTLIRLAGWPDLAGQVFVAAKAQHCDVIAADDYGLASELAFREHLPVVGIDPRWALFQLPKAALSGAPVLLVRSQREAGPPDPRLWSDVSQAGTVTRARNGIVAETYTLYRAVWRGAGALPVWLPEQKALPFVTAQVGGRR
jgi:4-amino-4-deoxy-L-arabinose transferase-like glycosyltransferase